MVVKNNVIVARGEGQGTVRRRVYRNYHKGHMDKIKGEGKCGRGRWDSLGWGGGMVRKCRLS